MRSKLFPSALRAVIGLLLTAPTLYIILISILKYGFGQSAPFDAAAPTLEAWGIKEPLGWNINLLILAGPFAALLLNLPAVLELDFDWTAHPRYIFIRLALRRYIKNWMIVGLSSLSLLLVLIYAIGENCT